MKKYIVMLIGLCFATIINANTISTELVINGGAEEGDTTGWVSAGIDAVVPDTPSEGFGSFVFTGGTGLASQTLLQTIDVSDLASLIDSNKLVSVFGIQLQSRAEFGALDEAKVDVVFRDSLGAQLDGFSFVDDINTYLFDWNYFTDTRVLMPETRSIDILLTATREDGIYSDGFFDEVSLVLNEVIAVSTPRTFWPLSTAAIILLGFRKNVWCRLKKI